MSLGEIPQQMSGTSPGAWLVGRIESVNRFPNESTYIGVSVSFHIYTGGTPGGPRVQDGEHRHMWLWFGGWHYLGKFIGGNQGPTTGAGTTWHEAASYYQCYVSGLRLPYNSPEHFTGLFSFALTRSMAEPHNGDFGPLVMNGFSDRGWNAPLQKLYVPIPYAWTTVVAPTITAVSPSSHTQLENTNMRVSWTAGASGWLNPLKEYHIYNGNTYLGKTIGQYYDLKLSYGTYSDIKVYSVGQYNSVPSNSIWLKYYQNVKGPSPIYGGIENTGYALPGGNVTISWSRPGTLNGYLNPVKYYTINGVNVGNIGAKTYASPAANQKTTYTVKSVGTMNSSQIGTSSKTIYGVGVADISSFNVSEDVIIDTVNLSWNTPSILSLNKTGLMLQYRLRYSVNNGDWVELGEVTGNVFTWQPTIEEVPFGSTVKFNITPKLYYLPTVTYLTTSGSSTSTANFLRGKLPNQLEDIIFTTNKYTNPFGETTPPATTFTRDESGEYISTGNFTKIANDLIINIKPGEKIDNYDQSASIAIDLYDGLDHVTGASFSTNVKTETSEYITCTIPADFFKLYKNSNLRMELKVVGNNIINDSIITNTSYDLITSFLSFDKEPRIDSVNAPVISTNETILINYNDKVVSSEISISNIIGIDEENPFFRNCGFKLYVLNQNNEQILINQNLFTNEGFWDIENKIFFPKINEETVLEIPSTIILSVLDDNKNEHLKEIYGDLSTINDIINLSYVISPVDSYYVEGIENAFNFTVQYDFRTVPKMNDAPILYNPLVTIDAKSELLYSIEKTISTSIGDIIVKQINNNDELLFEWYPAYDANNKNNYVEINNKYYLTEDKTDLIKNYVLEIWLLQNGAFNKINENTLNFGVDYFKFLENQNEQMVIKYRGKFLTNLSNYQYDEIIFCKIRPISSNDKTTEENIQLNNNFYISRLQTPQIFITDIQRDVLNEEIGNVYFQMTDNGGSKYFEDIVINSDNWNVYNNLLQLKINRVYSDGTGEYLTQEVPFIYDYGTQKTELNFTEESGQIISPQNGYNILLNATISAYKISSIIVENVLEANKTITTLISDDSNFYITPSFGTLSLRPNKIGVNYSSLSDKEEAMFVRGKNRVENSELNYYKNIMSIMANNYSKMPEFDGKTLEENIANQIKGAYLGFYSSEEETEKWLGSLGMDEDGITYEITETKSGNKIKESLGIPVGALVPFAGNDENEIPKNFLMAKGQVLDKLEYPVLYARIGDNWKVDAIADHQFQLPNLQGRSIVGAGVITDSWADSTTISFGSYSGTIYIKGVPSHYHSLAELTLSSTYLGTAATSGASGYTNYSGNLSVVNASHAHTGQSNVVRNGYWAGHSTYGVANGGALPGYVGILNSYNTGMNAVIKTDPVRITSTGGNHRHSMPAHTHTLNHKHNITIPLRYTDTRGSSTVSNYSPYISMNYLIKTK